MNDQVSDLYEQGFMQELTPEQLRNMTDDERFAY